MGLSFVRRAALQLFALIALCLLATWAPMARAQSDATCPLGSGGYAVECIDTTKGAPSYSLGNPIYTGPYSSESDLISAVQSWGTSRYCTFSAGGLSGWVPTPGFGYTSLTYSSTVSYSGTNAPAVCGHSDYPINGTVAASKTVSLSCPPGYFLAPTSAANPSGYCYIYLIQIDQTQKMCFVCMGNPLFIGTGNKHQEELDYLGSGPIPLDFHRVYNSGAQYFTRAVPLGNYWRTTYSRWITYYAQGANEVATINRPDGSFSFTWNGSIWVPDADVNYKLTGTAGALKVTTPDGREVEFYRGDGQLSSVKTVSGTVKYTLTYNTATPALLTQVSDPFGHSLVFTYDSLQRLATMTDPNGKVYQYGYDANSNLTSVTYPDTTVRTYVYNESTYTSGGNLTAALTGIVDESNTRFANFGYSTGGAAVLSEHAGGADRYSVNYATLVQFCTAPPVIDVPHHVKYLTTCLIPPSGVTVTDPLGTVRTYGFTGILGGVAATGSDQPCSHALCTPVPASQSLDANGNVASETDFNGNVTTHAFDLTRNLETSRTEAYGTSSARTTTTTWNASFRLPATITEPNRVSSYTYDTNGNVLTKTITDTTVSPHPTRTWTYTYDSYNRGLTENGPRTDVSDVTTYTYYACTTGAQCGQVQTVTDAAGHVTTYNTYNAHGQPLTITDANGVVTTLTYDLRQRLTSRQVGTETTTFSYWPMGLLKQVTLADSSYLLYSYDAAHRLTQISDGLGNAVDYTLDAMGNRTAENVYDPSSTLHRTHSRVFNGLNQLYKDVNAAGTAVVTTTLGYDANGNQSSIAAPLSRNTADAYDPLNRLQQITDPASGVTQLGYDANDNLTGVTDPRSLTTSYTYSGFSDLVTQVSPDTGATTNTYDSGGNLATSTDARGAVSTYTYDALNRVTSAAYKIGSITDQTISFTYDAGTNGKGHLTGASDANHSMSWGYDAQGRVTSKSQTVGGVALSVTYGYTNADLTSVITPSGQSVAYGYNANRQIVSVSVNGTTVLNSASYEPLGPVDGWTWGNATTASRTYDTDGKISQIIDSGSKTLSYDNAFRITGISDTSVGSANWSYGYDALDRITSGSSSGGVSRGWTYDANGNRLMESGTSASTYSISGTSNQITGITGALARTYAYDLAGNATSYSTVSATYNDAGRLKTITQGGATETLVYNTLGQRVKTSGGSAGTVLYAYDESGHVLGEYDGTGALIEETVWLHNIPVATLRPHSGGGVDIYYVHTDQLNTPRAVTRPSDNMLMWSWYSDPFGTDAANENPAGAGTFKYNLRFAGQLFDGQAGLHANGHRAYDPAVGGYTQSDPLGPAGGTYSTYAYVGGNPISRIDPLGLAGIEEDEIAEGEPGESNPAVVLRYDNLLDQIRMYDPEYQDEIIGPPNSVPTRADVARLEQELIEAKYSCPAPGATRTPSQFRRKPGSLGLFKGTDALRAENQIAADAAKAAGLDQDQARELHQEIGGQGLSYAEILQIAISIKNGTH